MPTNSCSVEVAVTCDVSSLAEFEAQGKVSASPAKCIGDAGPATSCLTLGAVCHDALCPKRSIRDNPRELERDYRVHVVMNIIACIVVGLLAGWIAERVTGRNHGLLTNLIVGIVGALVGGFLFSTLLGFSYVEGFNLPTIGVATAGSIILLALFGGVRRQPH